MKNFHRQLLGIAAAVLVLGAFAWNNLAHAESDQAAAIIGFVQSSSGAPVAEARVVLVHPFLGIRDWRHSDAHGRFRFRNVVPGQYGVLAWSPGFGKGFASFLVAPGRGNLVKLELKQP